MVERKIGERFFMGRIQLKVVLQKPGEGCRVCFFMRHTTRDDVGCFRPLDVVGPCIDYLRTDKTSIYFEEV